MHPDPATVLRSLHAVIMVVRLAAVALAVTGCHAIAVRLMMLVDFFIGFGSNQWVYLAPAGLGANFFDGSAAALAISSRPLARWIVPCSLGGCPACGHATGDDATACPEYGAACRTTLHASDLDSGS